ncbi:hypothetical protein [Chroococcus sp. FPU101]|uniref:hypothetical protein n=1 Tax=Chroococcus sp. FPU101 TaxID=1974212 RepID=UPI001A8DD137|nr:hypothetical protein [Chroococcus sp. FPU101]GFE69524.1 hypothetical protein CFPU101_21340 [Chroococcus sp. FPU101]
MIKISIKTIVLIGFSVILVSPSYGVSLISPNQGQNQEQQNRDIHDCYAVARQQTGLDPRLPSKDDSNPTPASRQRRQQEIQAYNQVLANCLKERGYSVE